MFVKSNRPRRNPKTIFIYYKELLAMGSKSERLAFSFLERFDNPKVGDSAYKNFFQMSNEKKDFVSEISVSYSRTYKRKIKVTGADSAHKTLRKMWDTNLLNIQEQFCVLFLNNSNEVVGFRCLSSGTLTASLVDFKILFGLACKSLSSAIIIAHNHPSGKLQPSQGDINVTKKIKEAGNMLDIKLLDHIILTQNDYYSLNDNHLI